MASAIKAVPAQHSNPYHDSDNPLVNAGGLGNALNNMCAFTVFLADYFANLPGDTPGPEIRHGRYLAACVLADALARVGEIEAKRQEGGPV